MLLLDKESSFLLNDSTLTTFNSKENISNSDCSLELLGTGLEQDFVVSLHRSIFVYSVAGNVISELVFTKTGLNCVYAPVLWRYSMHVGCSTAGAECSVQYMVVLPARGTDGLELRHPYAHFQFFLTRGISLLCC